MFILGAYGLVTKKDGLKLILAIELLVVACNVVFIAAGFESGENFDRRAESYVLLSLAVGGAVVGLALSLLARYFRQTGTADVSTATSLRW